MANVIDGVQADGQVIRHLIRAKLLTRDQGLCKAERELIRCRRCLQEGLIKPSRRIWVLMLREGDTPAGIVFLPGLVIKGRKNIVGYVVKQLPS